MLRQLVIDHLERALLHLVPAVAFPPLRVEYAREEQFGDYACTVAMDRHFRELAAASRPEFKNPRAFAQALQIALQEDAAAAAFFARIEVAGPGFLNLHIAPAELYRTAVAAVRAGDSFGRSVKAHPRRILFEFVSANPTGPLNVVSARAAALGDSCCNLLEAAGDSVYREFYVNDSGNQVELLGKSCLLRYLEKHKCVLKFAERETPAEDEPAEEALATPAARYTDGPGLRFPAEGYHGEYIKDVVTAIGAANQKLGVSPAVLKDLQSRSKSEDLPEDFLDRSPYCEAAQQLGRAAIDWFQQSQRADLLRFRVPFDNFYSERSLHDSGAVLAARDALGDHVFVEQGKTLFRSTQFGDDKDRVIIRDDGRPTYLLADIAYHKTKMDRGFDQIYNIWGPDHHGYIRRLAGAMQAMGHPPEGFRVLIAQQVNLLDQGKQLRMSKRAGRLITMAELMDDVPIDVSRYFFVMRAFESHLDYDLSEARDTSEKNPYYYVAYAHARIASIFHAAAERGLRVADGAALSIEMTAERRRLLTLAARFPDEVADVAHSLEPHRLINYLYHLATALSQFYGPRENRVIQQDSESAGQLLLILAAVKIVLRNGLRLLGMEAPEQMRREEVESAEVAR